jgi:hypothetical protein
MNSLPRWPLRLYFAFLVLTLIWPPRSNTGRQWTYYNLDEWWSGIAYGPLVVEWLLAGFVMVVAMLAFRSNAHDKAVDTGKPDA